jgi:eukaryotic-like serine/threonine-protein kinase
MLEDPFEWVGATIADKYRVDEVIGEGGFGTVYRGHHIGLGEPVAIKCLKVPDALEGERLEKFNAMFLEEGRLMYRLSRANDGIVLALDLGTATSPNETWTPYLVLEWLEGRTLQQVLAERAKEARGGYSLAEALDLLEPAASALDAAHEQRVAHRDIKPANLFLTSSGGRTRVKVLDFGIAKVIKENVGLTEALNVTDGAVRAFTPKYGAPEQFDRKRGATGPWTDVYALALVFVELVSGRPAQQGDNLMSLMMASIDTVRPTLGACGVKVPPEVDAVLAKALAVDPRGRHASAGEFWRALRAAAALPVPVAPSEREETVEALPSAVLEVVHQTAARPAPPPFATTGTPLAIDVRPSQSGPLVPMIPAPPRAQRRDRDNRALLFGLGGAAVLAALVMVIVHFAGGGDDVDGDARITRPKPAESAVTPVVDPKKKAEEERAARDKLSGAMAKLPGGTFMMGLADDPGEAPAHSVTVAAFEMDVTEVTVAAYAECVRAGGCSPASPTTNWPGAGGTAPVYDKYCNARFADRPRHPINCVDWSQADAFCRWAGKRLPTEEEWDYAARGGVAGARFPWGNAEPGPTLANRCGIECQSMYLRDGFNGRLTYTDNDSYETTAPVGSFLAGNSKHGLEDMQGNVWEWTASRFCSYGSPNCGSELRTLRGRSWDDYMPQSAGVGPDRAGAPATNRLSSVGFRCAR